MKFEADYDPDLIAKYHKWHEHEGFSAAAGLVTTLTFFALFWLIISSNAAAVFILRRSRIIRLCQKYPKLLLAVGYCGLAWVSNGWNNAAGWSSKLVFGLVAWIVIGLIAACIFKLQNSRPLGQRPRFIEWFKQRLKNPRDARMVRRIAENTFVILPSLILVVVPAVCSVWTVSTYLMVIFRVFQTQEFIIHYDVHNHFFRWKHLTSKRDQIVFRSVNLYTKIIVPFLSCRIPFSYSITHGIIHHCEDNGIDDIQTTVFHDRKSCLDFCRFVWAKGLEFLVPRDAFRYLAERNMSRPARALLRGYVIWYTALLLIGLFNPIAAVILFLVPLLTSIPLGIGTLFWHGLVDVTDPRNLYTNTISLELDSESGLGSHIEHHLRPNSHWTQQGKSAQSDSENYGARGVIVFRSVENVRFMFMKALWTRDFKSLTKLCVPTCELQCDLSRFAELLDQRSEPLIRAVRTPLYEAVDRKLGQCMAKLLPGDLEQAGSATRSLEFAGD
jgi:fatty acid desaturase